LQILDCTTPPLAATQVLFIHQINKRIGREGCSR